MSIISLKDVWLKYKIEFKENGRVIVEDFWALKNINIEIEKGEVVGIIGENGAGKTTILKIMAGMLKPDKGVVNINGKVSTLTEIGAGFHRELTGKENIYIISSLFGLTQKQIDDRHQDIINFASIGRFINAPVRVYSQGMYMRLAFAIAIHVNPDILLIDDIFAVGDIYAQHKCINKMFELKEQGKTIIFVNQDTEILKRLCTKGIFIREGSIVKEGPMDKICGYYMESVGEKKGIAILQKDLLGVIFNNGKLALRWRNESITCGSGGHTVILSSGRQYLSNTADWEVQKSKTSDEIIAIGKWRDLPLVQYWKIAFLNGIEFLWEITMQMSGDIAIERFCTEIVFTDAYKKWFTLDTETDFPKIFIHEKEWECNLVSDSISKVIGLKGNNQAVSSLPVVILDRSQDNMEIKCEVCNTGAEINGRAVQYQLFYQNPEFNYVQDKYRCFMSKVRIFEPEEEADLGNYISHIKQIIDESYIIRRGLIGLFCKDHKIEVYYQDKLFTNEIGLATRFKFEDKNYNALDGTWVIRKASDEEIVITISWGETVPFIQTWKLKLQDNDAIFWEIEMDVAEKIRLRNKETELMLSEEYEKWITSDEKGDFRRLDKQGSTVLLDNYINEHIGVESVYKMDEIILPSVTFNYKDGVYRASYISKMKEGMRATRLRYVEIDSKNNFYIPSGKHKYFKGSIKVSADLDKKTAIKGAGLLNKIEFNSMSLVFDNGKGRLFWKGIELTKGLGLCSSVFLKGVWYDSSQAFWEIQKLDQKRLTAVSYWPWIPLTQTWKICLADENTVIWEIEKEIWDNVILEREQASLMLSDHYQEWSVNKQVRGKFPEAFSEPNGIFWDRLWCGDITSSIRVEQRMVGKKFLAKQFLPAVTFDCSIDCQARHFIIENTDNLFEARALQCEFNSNQKYSVNKDKDKYFKGRIKINI